MAIDPQKCNNMSVPGKLAVEIKRVLDNRSGLHLSSEGISMKTATISGKSTNHHVPLSSVDVRKSYSLDTDEMFGGAESLFPRALALPIPAPIFPPPPPNVAVASSGVGPPRIPPQVKGVTGSNPLNLSETDLSQPKASLFVSDLHRSVRAQYVPFPPDSSQVDSGNAALAQRKSSGGFSVRNSKTHLFHALQEALKRVQLEHSHPIVLFI